MQAADEEKGEQERRQTAAGNASRDNFATDYGYKQDISYGCVGLKPRINAAMKNNGVAHEIPDGKSDNLKGKLKQ